MKFVIFFKPIQLVKSTFTITLFLGMMVYITSCNTKVASDIPPELLNNKNTPSQEATDLKTTLTDSGIVRYFLETPKLLIFDQVNEKEPYKEFPEGFHLQEFDKNKKIISELSANYGKNFIKEERWLATGNVVMVNSKGDTLFTEELNYDTRKDRIYTDKFARIVRGDMQDLVGTGGFESDSQMKKTVFKKVKGPIYFEGQ